MANPRSLIPLIIVDRDETMTYDWTLLLTTFFPGFVGAFGILLLDLKLRNSKV